MPTPSLEARIRVLEDMEAIKKLNYKYWRCICQGLWDEVADCFTQEGFADFGPEIKLRGRDTIAKFYKETMSPKYSLRVPQGHSIEIEITGETTATGISLVDMSNIDASSGKGARIGAMYHDVYAKENGAWKMKSKIVTYLYRQASELHKLTTSAIK